MTVSNPASFSSIKAEFGGSNNFSDYYRGGPYVSSAVSAAISTTIAGLAMSQFNGVSKPAGITGLSIDGPSVLNSPPSGHAVGYFTPVVTGGTGVTFSWAPLVGLFGTQAPYGTGVSVTSTRINNKFSTRINNKFSTDSFTVSVTATSTDGSKMTASRTFEIIGIN